MSIDFENSPAEWNNEGVEPSVEIKNSGFSAGDKPPAAWINWQFNKTYKSIDELQNAVSDIDTEVKTTVPITRGGTGATNVSDAWANMQMYTSVGQLGLSYPCTAVEICNAMPNKSIFTTNIEDKQTTVTDVPVSWGLLNIIKISNSRKKLEFARAMGTDCTRYIGGYSSSDTTVLWKYVPHGVVSINQGGTGANTANGALTNLGAAPISHSHSASDITSGILPISLGGTGAASFLEAQKNLQIYTDVTQLGLTYPCTMLDIINALPVGSTANLGYNLKSDGITDAPISYGQVSIFFPSMGRRLIFCTQCISSGGEFSNFYLGYYNSSEQTISWYKITNGSMVTSLANGGTGATTASEALSNLGAVPATRTINSKALSSNVTLSASDVGAAIYEAKSNADFNDVQTPGLYTMRSSTTNAPTSGSYHSLIVNKSDTGNYVQQLAIKEGTTQMYIRYGSSSWGAWKKFALSEEVPTNEFGTWTPSIDYWEGGYNGTYTASNSYYYKIGRMVYVQCRVKFTSSVSGSHNVSLNGLPFMSSAYSVGDFNLNGEVEMQGHDFVSKLVSVGKTKNYITFDGFGAGEIDNNRYLTVSLTYITN